MMMLGEGGDRLTRWSGWEEETRLHWWCFGGVVQVASRNLFFMIEISFFFFFFLIWVIFGLLILSLCGFYSGFELLMGSVMLKNESLSLRSKLFLVMLVLEG